MNIGDYLRTAARSADELFIEGTGRELFYYRRLVSQAATDQVYDVRAQISWTNDPIVLRGFYETPLAEGVQQFGIDSPDEMDVELGYETTLKKVGAVPSPGDLIVTNKSEKWVVLTRRRKDDMLRGQNRLVLTVQRFQESATTA
jgi:hypothetical protein